jgi:hypothetical protein
MMKWWLVAMMAMSMMDVISTEQFLSKGYKEANPMQQNRAVRIASHVAIPLVTWFIGEKLTHKGKHLPKWARHTTYAFITFTWANATLHNYDMWHVQFMIVW